MSMETKGIVRVPTKTQYAFIEMHVEGTPQEIVRVYNELNEAYWGQGEAGLPQKEWNRLLDGYLNGGGMHAEEMEGLSEKQGWMIHEIDKCFNRLGHKKE